MFIVCSLQCRRILARLRASAFDQASAILDSNSEEAWGKTKMRPREWVGVGVRLKEEVHFSPRPPYPLFPSQYGGEFQYGGELTIASLKKKNACTAGYIVCGPLQLVTHL